MLVLIEELVYQMAVVIVRRGMKEYIVERDGWLMVL